MARSLLAWLIVAVGFTAWPASAQSLAEIARNEEARRKTLAAKSRTYTNEDLKRFGQQPATAQAADASRPAPGDATAATVPAAPGRQEVSTPPPPPPPDPAKEEQAWRDRITAARGRLERATLFLEALQSRVNALTNDFYARDDPAQRAVIASNRNRALAEMERVKQDIVDATRAIADIEEEARKAGVPPGWLR